MSNLIKKMLFAAMAIMLSQSSLGKPVEKVTSPDGHLTLITGVESGQAFYSLQRDNTPVINKSRLGFMLSDGMFADNFKLCKASRSSLDETWETVWGESRLVRNNYNELRIELQERNGKKRKLNIVFRVFNDGMGFRYEFPKQSALTDFEIMEELTEFAMPCDPPTWSQPTNGTKYYEALYTKEPLSKKDTISTPITIEAKDDMFLSIHEANLTDYASLNLTPRNANDGITLKCALTPWHSGVKVYASSPSKTPWRTIVVARKPGDLITSNLILNLNEPSQIEDTSWIQPGRYIGIWWGMHMTDYTWEQGPRHGATTENTKRYIDFAAKHGFSGVLVEGWNEGWDGEWTRIGNHFNFTKPYPDYDLKELASYAKDKGVRIIAHNETGGTTTNYEDQMEEAFRLYQQLGINCVKTGYVNPMLDGIELQHSQYGIRHYRKVVETAAKYHLMIDNHEPAMPTGLRRTWPNLMTGEGARGMEYNAWSNDGGNPPYHICILPFTRGLAGPLDYTPGVFNFNNKAVPGTRPQTTLAKQLAEYVVIYSPLQMAADMIENYEHQPALTFIESCPTTWDTTVVVDAEIGKYIVTARKDRNSDNWFIGGVTDEEARTVEVPLTFLESNSAYRAIIYADSPNADYKDNPYAMTIDQKDVDHDTVLKIDMARSGGFAIRIEKIPMH